jgi:hypothetical protein
MPISFTILKVFGGFIAFGFLGLFIGPTLVPVMFTLIKVRRIAAAAPRAARSHRVRGAFISWRRTFWPEDSRVIEELDIAPADIVASSPVPPGAIRAPYPSFLADLLIVARADRPERE